MSKLLDHGLIALSLATSVAYALFSLGPRALRRRLWTALARAAASAPSALHLGGLARRLDAAAGKDSSACGGCESCGPEPSTNEVRVPLAKLGKRTSAPPR